MARARSLKPAFFTDVVVLDLQPLTRLLFAGLWTIADREGRLNDNPRQIKVDVMPEDKCDINKMLQDLHKSGLIVRYQIDGKRYIQVVNFRKHQNPHRDERASTIPAPSLHGESTCEHGANTVQLPQEHSTNRALTLNPVTITSNLTPDCGSPAPAPRPKRRSADGTTATGPDPSVVICDAVAAYTSRPNAEFAYNLTVKCCEADPSITPELITFAIHAVVRENYKITTPGFFMETVPELIQDEKDWKMFKSFPEHGRDPQNIADAKAYLRDPSAPERLRRFLVAWLASMQSQEAA